jgi:hypothetical protein
MKPFLVVITIAAFGPTATVASAQSGMATAPVDRSTGPTFPGTATDTRPIDPSIASVPAGSGPATTASPTSENGRSSSAIDAAPDSGAASGPSTGAGDRGR